MNEGSKKEVLEEFREPKYWAFISYSSVDKKWGRWLHKAIETYPIPKDLVGRDNGTDGNIPRRLFPIFRDRDELPSSADLNTAIRRALVQSRYLIVVCSPRAVRSRWVDEEVRQFKQARGEDRVLCVIVDGEPHAADKPDSNEQHECFPQAVRFRVGVDGRLRSEPAEPLAADVRPSGDGRQRALLKLVAGILQISFDDLIRRDQRRRSRRARITAAVSLALLCVFAALSLLLYWQLQATRDTLARSDFQQGTEKLDQEDVSTAQAYLARSIREGKHSGAALRVSMFLQQRSWGLPVAVVRHENAVRYSCFSPDGKRVATVSGNEVRVFNAASGSWIGQPIRSAARVRTVRFSQDGNRLLIASGEDVNYGRNEPSSEPSAAQMWEVSSGKAIGQPMKHEQAVLTAEFSPDGKWIVTASDDRTARIWNAETGAASEVLRHQGRVTTAAFSPDSRFVVTAFTDESDVAMSVHSGFAHIWNVAAGKTVGGAMHNDGFVHSVRFSPDGKLVVTGHEVWRDRGYARLWDAFSGSALTDPISDPPGRETASGDGSALTAVEFAPDGKRLLTASLSGSSSIWGIFTSHGSQGNWLAEMSGEIMKHARGVTTAHFSRDGRWVVTATVGGISQLWDVEHRNSAEGVMSHSLRINSVEFSPDGTHIVTASDDSTARVWEIMHPKRQEPGTSYWEWAASVRVQDEVRDGDAVTREPPLADSRVIKLNGSVGELFEAQGAEQALASLEHSDRINSAEFSIDGRLVVTASRDRTVRVWDAATGDPQSPSLVHPREVVYARLSQDNERIVTGDIDGAARIWNWRRGIEEVPTLRHVAAVTYADFSSDGRHVVTTSQDKTARVWNVKTGAPEGKPMLHDLEAVYAHFSPDGRFVATTAKHWFPPNWMEQRARLWDAATGNPLSDVIQIYGEDGGGPALAKFSPDGRWLLVVSGDEKRWFNLEANLKRTEWLANWAETIGGSRLNRTEGISPVDYESSVIDDLRTKVGEFSDTRAAHSSEVRSPASVEASQPIQRDSTSSSAISEAALILFIEGYTKSGEGNSPEEEMKYYAQSVENYFGDKNVNAKFILANKGKQIQRWPQRSYVLENPKLLRKEGDNVYVLSAKVRYVVRNSASTQSGVTETIYKVHVSGGRLELFHIAEMKTE